MISLLPEFTFALLYRQVWLRLDPSPLLPFKRCLSRSCDRNTFRRFRHFFASAVLDKKLVRLGGLQRRLLFLFLDKLMQPEAIVLTLLNSLGKQSLI